MAHVVGGRKADTQVIGHRIDAQLLFRERLECEVEHQPITHRTQRQQGGEVGAGPIAETQAQRTGQSARITVGVVTQAQRVSLKSNTARNSLLGGAAGWALARNQSSGRQAAAALGGAALAGGATSRSQGDNMAMQYTIQSAGSAVQVITDQTEIRIGDCVTVEETSNGANVRRADPAMCKASPQVLEKVKGEMQEEANECNQAKQRLINAKTKEEVDVARQVVEILCND
ncbi:MAG: hypothetical protein ABJ308_14885 [Halieaceae bacterium]